MATTLKEKLAEIDDLKRQLDAMRPLKPDQEQRVFQKLRLDWNYHSNAIEGNQLSAGETRLLLMEGTTASGKPLKDYLDIKGHNHVIDFLVDFIRKKEELTEATIREMHRLLLVQTYEVTAVTPEGGQTKKWVKLGQYKEEPNQIRTPTGETKYFVVPSEVPEKMRELIVRMRAEQREPHLHPVAFASLFHHEFVSIHPFDDGNGRMGRLLMNLLLMQSHFPPAVIRIEDRERYFMTLSQGDSGDLEPLTAFIAEQVTRSLELYLRAAKGEAIEEADDIDKKIKLLVKEVESGPEPIPFSGDVYVGFVKDSLSRLLAKCFSKTSDMDKLFLKSQLLLRTSAATSTVLSKEVDFVTRQLLTRGVPHTLVFQFTWEQFKKAGANAFSYSSELQLSFEPITYSVTWGKPTPTTWKKVYADALTGDECRAIANDLAEELYEAIRGTLDRAAPPAKL